MSCIVSICIISGGLVALNNDGTVGVFMNKRNTWILRPTLKITLPTNDFISISAALSSPDNIVAITPTSGAYTVDGGMTKWISFDFPLGLAAAGVSKTAASTIILIYPNGFVRRSLDNGTTWESPGNIGGLRNILRVSTNGNQIFVVDNAGKVALTTDGNAKPISWVTTTASGLPNPVGVSGKNAAELSVVAANGNGRFSTNGGQTWADWGPANKPTITDIVDMAAAYVVMNTVGKAERTPGDVTPPTGWGTPPSIPQLIGPPNDCSAPSNIIYVDGNSGSIDSNCGTKANPCKFLQAALAQATRGMQVWVAKGTYKLSNINESFSIPSGVKVYGGFVDNFSKRDPAMHVTTLSGDLGGGSRAKNVTSFANTDSTTTLDGFTITGGGVLDADFGGGCLNINASPKIVNCLFSGNKAKFGGAVSNEATGVECSPVFGNCVFSGNEAVDGGAVHNVARNNACKPSFENCVFSENNADRGGGDL